MGSRPAVLAVGIQHRPRGRTAAGADRMEFAGPASVSDRRELVERYLEPLATRTAARRSHPDLEPRHRRSAASASTRSRPRAGKARRSRSATRTAKARSVVRADAVIDASGTWHAPNPAGANGLPAIGERGGKPHRLWHARRAGQARAAMPARPSPYWARDIRQSARSSIWRSLRNEAPATRRLAFAGRQSRQGVRRRRQRQARSAWRTRQRIRRNSSHRARSQIESAFAPRTSRERRRAPRGRRRLAAAAVKSLSTS